MILCMYMIAHVCLWNIHKNPKADGDNHQFPVLGPVS